MNYSVKFHQKFYFILMVMKLWSQISFFIYKFPLPLNTTSPNGNVLEWILRIKWDTRVGEACSSRYQKDFSTKITLVFHFHYHRLLLFTKRTVIIRQKNLVLGNKLKVGIILGKKPISWYYSWLINNWYYYKKWTKYCIIHDNFSINIKQILK